MPLTPDRAVTNGVRSGVVVNGVRTVAAVDPLAALSDDWTGGSSDVQIRGWQWYRENAVATQMVSGGVLELDPVAGGNGPNGTFWYNNNRGFHLFKLVSGAADMRSRLRVTDSAGADVPPASSFRLGGIAVHDPQRPDYNFLHVVGGTVNNAQGRVEWKTNDGALGISTSTFDSVADPSGALNIDLRIVRSAANLQVFNTYVRASSAQPNLASDDGWTLVQLIDRADNTAPLRQGGVAAVAMPDELEWGLIVYAVNAVHDVKQYNDGVEFKTVAA